MPEFFRDGEMRDAEKDLQDRDATIDKLKTEVSKLKSALWDACGTIEWMSGSPDFGPEGKAHVGWVKAQPDINRYHSLAVQGSGGG